ncbi:MAG: hypothetical protein VKK63_12135 [Synechococcus sp.]|nr:hypothetical protein [Synechococcus sp.]
MPSPTSWRATMADHRILITHLCDELDHNRRMLLDDRQVTHPLADRARAALAADGPAVPEGREPAAVTHEVSDEDLKATYWKAYRESAMRGAEDVWLAGLRAVADLCRPATPSAPAAGEVGELVAWLGDEADQYACIQQAPETARRLRRAADLLEQRQAAPVPVPVSERPWEREGWCHPEERWAWFYNRRVGWRNAIPPTLFPYTHSVPFNALPVPAEEVE